MLPNIGRSCRAKTYSMITGNGWSSCKEFCNPPQRSFKLSNNCCRTLSRDTRYFSVDAGTISSYGDSSDGNPNKSKPVTCTLGQNTNLWKRHQQKVKKNQPSPSRARVLVKSKGLEQVTSALVHVDEKEWETVYRFKHIRTARVIQGIKIYQTFFTSCLALPFSVGGYLYDAVTIEVVQFILASSLFACGMLYIMGTFCSRLIGVIYVSRTDDSLVRIAHLNFWGNREDQLFSKSEFTPFSELPDNVSDIYVNVRFYSEPDTKLHICVRYGTVYNRTQFLEIFGSHAGLSIVENDETNTRSKNQK